MKSNVKAILITVLSFFIAEAGFAQVHIRVAPAIELEQALKKEEQGFISTKNDVGFGMGIAASVQYAFLKLEGQVTAHRDQTRNEISNSGVVNIRFPLEMRLYLADKLELKKWYFNPYLGMRWMNSINGLIELTDVINADQNTDYTFEFIQNENNTPMITMGMELRPSSRSRAYPSVLFGMYYASHDLERLTAVGVFEGTPINHKVRLNGWNTFLSIRFIL